jgi:hypothetical protein
LGILFSKPDTLEEAELQLVEYQGLGNKAIYCTLDWGGYKTLFQLTPRGLDKFGPMQDGFCRSVVVYFRYLVERHGKH